jgi:hypothetical protein
MKRMNAVMAALFLLIPATSSALEAKDPAPCAPVSAHNDLVKKTFRYSVGGYGGDFRVKPIRTQNYERLGEMRACWKRVYREAYVVEKRVWRRERATYRDYAYLDRITPYGEWAIPEYVVRRESWNSGKYNAINHGGCGGRGCYGYAQFDWAWWTGACAKYARMYGSWQSPAAQHRCAYYLMNNGGLYTHWPTA